MILIKPYLNTTFLQMKFGDVAYNSSSRSVLKKLSSKQVSLNSFQTARESMLAYWKID